MKKIMLLLGISSCLGSSLFAAGDFIIKNECPFRLIFEIHTFGKDKNRRMYTLK